MLRFKLVPAVMAALIAASTGGVAFAATDGDGKNDDAKEIAAALSAKMTASQAIAAAEQNTGGRAIEFGLESENGRVLYNVKTVTKDKVLNVYVDPDSGQIVRSEEEGLIDRIVDREDKAQLARLMKSPTTLAAAIAAAEQHTGGKVIEAAYDDEDGGSIFGLEVVKNNARHNVKIDGATGSVLNVAPGEGGNNHEH